MILCIHAKVKCVIICRNWRSQVRRRAGLTWWSPPWCTQGHPHPSRPRSAVTENNEMEIHPNVQMQNSLIYLIYLSLLKYLSRLESQRSESLIELWYIEKRCILKCPLSLRRPACRFDTVQVIFYIKISFAFCTTGRPAVRGDQAVHLLLWTPKNVCSGQETEWTELWTLH